MIFKLGTVVLSYTGSDPEIAINHSKRMGWTVHDVKIIREENGISIKTKRDIDVGNKCNEESYEALEREWFHIIS